MAAGVCKRIIKLLGLGAIMLCLNFLLAPQAGLAKCAPQGALAMANLLPPGAFAPAPAPAAPRTNKWFPVPEWLAGTWESKKQTILEAYDVGGEAEIDAPVNVNVERITVIGAQRDKAGRIWHFAGTPYERTVGTDSMILDQEITMVDLVKSDAESLTVNSIAEVTRVSKATNKPVDKLFEQTVTTYLPLTGDLIQVNFSITDYDTAGNEIAISRDVSIAKRVAPFKIVNSDERGNLQLLFQQYMKGSGMEKLLPGM